ncbi:alpha-glucosidase-like [Copidosoma floridanum]|uniref:alpha-glucosidase-like n=1 Tax=Copidosoma floridanum TaxID=29053 RepID=UPI0006C99B18|nr:alpha-glucosidase-like [Copidosoma floridanum]
MKILIAGQIILLLFCKIHGEPLEWWKTMSLYQIYPRSFKDSDGDGVGDLKGILSKFQHVIDSKFDAIWLSSIYSSPMKDFGYDVTNYRGIDPIYGTMKDFENLLNKAHSSSIKVIMDFVPNHSSNKHEWFQKSVKKVEPYTDYYVWHPGKMVNRTRQPPNNWVNAYYGSAWTWNEERQAYYLHQFLPEQPDLNYRNEKVVEEMKNVLRFWLDKGVDGFRVDAVPHLVEAKELLDEPLTGTTNDSNSYEYTVHIYTTNQLETYEMVRQWRNVIDEYKNKSPRVLMLEIYGDPKETMDYYCYGASFPFNFRFIFTNQNTTAEQYRYLIDEWMDHMPIGSTANWVAGNHDNTRIVSSHGCDFAPVVTTMVQLLPGVAVTYNGEEIGMEDTILSWQETKDSQACRVGEKLFSSVTRDPARTPFQWDSSVSAGFSTNPKPWLRVHENYKKINLAAQKAVDKSYYKSFVKVTNLRKLPVIKIGSFGSMMLSDNVFAFSRDLNGEKSIYVVINAGYEAETVDLKKYDDTLDKVKLYTALPVFKDVKDGEIMESQKLHVNARSAYIFTAVD